jgi:hypothetical protein
VVDLSDVAEIGRDGIDVSHSALEAEKDTGFRLVAAPDGRREPAWTTQT